MGRESVQNRNGAFAFKNLHTKSSPVPEASHEAQPASVFLRNSVVYASFAAFAAITFKIHQIISDVQPGPFIDEVCHVPQAQEYCRGNFTYWDKRITTLPGLYLLSVGILRPLSLWQDTFLCDAFNLRLTNVCLAVCNFMLYIWTTEQLHGGKNYNSWKGLLSAANLAIFPPLYFFSFLYYTDVAAVCLMLLVFNLHLSERNITAACMAIISILMRQTNIVWTVFCAARALDVILTKYFLPKANQSSTTHSWRQVPAIISGMASVAKQPFRRWSELGFDILKNIVPYILVGISFIAFVVWNGGLVVGDRSAHTATIHFPQLFYFFAFSAGFCFAHFLGYIKPFLRSITTHWIISVSSAIVILLVVHYNTMAHPYLLSDNRHYTFYVWMRFFQRSSFGRYLFWPVYMFGAFCVYKTVQQKQSFLITLTFLACCILALVPQKLLECRYFIIPYIQMRLHVKPESWFPLVLETVLYLAVNAVTINIFLTISFAWPDTSEPQRIIW